MGGAAGQHIKRALGIAVTLLGVTASVIAIVPVLRDAFRGYSLTKFEVSEQIYHALIQAEFNAYENPEAHITQPRLAAFVEEGNAAYAKLAWCLSLGACGPEDIPGHCTYIRSSMNNVALLVADRPDIYAASISNDWQTVLRRCKGF